MSYGWKKYPNHWGTLDCGHRLHVERVLPGLWEWRLTDIRDGADQTIIVERGGERSFKAAKDAASEAARYRGEKK